MERHAFAMKVQKGRMGEYRAALGSVWTELTLFLDRKEIRNFSIWNAGELIFGYCETEGALVFGTDEKECIGRWEKAFGDSFEWISTPFQEMRLMYHDFGIVRESKELIRHRVFMTKLAPGYEEEYKARHDRLVEQRGNVVNPGPDSNFSIWNAGGYIFGYNEIDTTMEHEMTEEERKSTIAWEKRMLEIMSWVTNDVDWITGEHKEQVKRLAWHATGHV